jgi:hypothetical protein
MTLPVRPWAAAPGTQPLQQLERPLGITLGDQQAGQQQVLALARVAGRVLHVQTVRLHPAGGVGNLAIGDGQFRP